jgi:hypothetical protein
VIDSVAGYADCVVGSLAVAVFTIVFHTELHQFNPSAWGHLIPSSYCDVGRFFYRVFNF